MPGTFYEIFLPKARAHPERIYARMRRTDPVCRLFNPFTNTSVWFITRYDDAVNVLKDARFGKDVRKAVAPEQLANHPSQRHDLELINRNMTFTDPPEHTRLRASVSKVFTPHRIDGMRRHVERIAATLLETADTQTSFDLVAGYAYPLPLIVIAEMLGVPPEQRDQFHAWTRAIVFEPDADRTAAAVEELSGYFREVFQERRSQPRDDLISALIGLHESADVLSEEELLGMVCMLLVAGHETTLNLIANGTLALLQHADQLRTLRTDPSLIPGAVEEMLRFDSPVENTVRWALEEVEIGGKTIPRGALVLVSLAAANRDPDVFADPDIFLITRAPNKHIAFGQGIHYCLGAALARLEGEIAISALVQHFPEMQLAVDPDSLEWGMSLLAHSLNALPLRLR